MKSVLRARLQDPSKCSQRDNRERQLIGVVVQIKYLREAGPRGQFFVPVAVRTLRLQQILDAMIEAGAARVAAGKQAHDGPRGLRWGALSRSIHAVIVARTALAPSAIGILDRSEEHTSELQSLRH